MAARRLERDETNGVADGGIEARPPRAAEPNHSRRCMMSLRQSAAIPARLRATGSCVAGLSRVWGGSLPWRAQVVDLPSKSATRRWRDWREADPVAGGRIALMGWRRPDVVERAKKGNERASAYRAMPAARTRQELVRAGH